MHLNSGGQRGQEESVMSRFMMIYKGDATDMSEMTPEYAAKVMAAWAAWVERIGPALADIGTPFGPATSVVDDGSAGTPAWRQAL